MLPLPAQNWRKALRATEASLDPSRNEAFGRLASQITPRIYLSDYRSARDAGKLESLGITHVISVVEFTPDLPDIIPQNHKLHIALADVAEAKILDHLDATTAFILKALAENNANKVLVSHVYRQSPLILKCYGLKWKVHCMQGISRSATVVCAYLVATTDLTAPKSIEYVQFIRKIVCPNIGFRRQLDEYSMRYIKLKPSHLQTAYLIFSKSVVKE